MVRSLDDWRDSGDYGGAQARMVAASASISRPRHRPTLHLVGHHPSGARTGEPQAAGGQPQARPPVDHIDSAERPTHIHVRESRWHRFITRHQRQTGADVAHHAAIVEEQLERSNYVFEVMGEDRIMLSDLMGD